MNKNKRKKLRDILAQIGTPDDLREVDVADAFYKANKSNFDAMTKQLDRLDKLDKAPSLEDLKKLSQDFQALTRVTQAEMSKVLKSMVRAHMESSKDFSDTVVEHLGKLGTTISTSYEKNKPENAAGTYKDMINQLSAIDKSVRDKPVPVWNWPQYAAVSVRDKNFANINPATEEAAQFSGGYAAQKVQLVTGIAYIATAATGTAQSAPQWQACKIDYSNLENITTTWAGGSKDFTNVATDLTALSYS